MKISQVTWKAGAPTKGIDAAKAHAALEKIRKDNNGLTDDAIVESAKPKNHTLHKWFEWDDSKAATEHRRQQARELVRSVHVVYEEAPEVKTRLYEIQRKVQPRQEGRTVYSTADEVLRDPAARDALIATAIRQAMEFRRRFKGLHELDHVMQAIDKTIESLGMAAVES